MVYIIYEFSELLDMEVVFSFFFLSFERNVFEDSSFLEVSEDEV